MIFISLCLYFSGSKPPAPFSTLSSSTSWPTSWTGPLVTFLNNHCNLITNSWSSQRLFAQWRTTCKYKTSTASVASSRPPPTISRSKIKQKNSGIMVIMTNDHRYIILIVPTNQVTAHNHAGSRSAAYQFSTLTPLGSPARSQFTIHMSLSSLSPCVLTFPMSSSCPHAAISWCPHVRARGGLANVLSGLGLRYICWEQPMREVDDSDSPTNVRSFEGPALALIK